MRRFLIAAALAGLLPFHAALAQQASRSETATIDDIARCRVQGLPQDWVSAQMTVDLKRAGDATGSVRYLVLRKDAPDRPESFVPCDAEEPPVALIGLRRLQPAERQGWTSARLVLQRDGSFRLNYDFPK